MSAKRPNLKLVDVDSSKRPNQAAHDLDWSIMMARGQSGDADAYRRLLRAIAPYLRARALARLGTPDEAEDALQDTLLTIHEARQTYDPRRPFGPWLVAIADRRISDRLRRRYRRRSLADALEPPCSGDQPGQEKAVLDARALQAAIAELTPEQAQAIRLLKIEERSLEEAAVHTGQSVGALKAATHRALKALRRRLFEGPPQ